MADELVVWVCRPPEAELIDAETVEWRADSARTTGPLVWTDDPPTL